METTQPVIELDIFQGPLDLLLYLIHKNEINIYDIPIATVTRQYLEYLELLQELNLDVAGEYILLAVQLIEIKIRMLLPKPPVEEGPEEDLRNALVEQLIEYQRFKKAAQQLKEQKSMNELYWPRLGDDSEEEREELVEASLYDLVNAFALLIKGTTKREALSIRPDEFSVKEKIQELSELLERTESFSLIEYAKRLQVRAEMIVLFLAILEMIRLRMLRIYQGEIFGDIVVYRD